MKFIKYFLFTLILVFTSSCITSSIESEEKRVSISFKVENLGTELEIGNSIIEIEEFKFPLEQLSLYAADDVIVQTRSEVSALIFSYNDLLSEPRLVIEVGLGFSDITNFEGYEMILTPLTNTRGIVDGDFFGSTQNYSVIIKGTIDDIEFDMRSTESFTKFFDLGNVELTTRLETLFIEKTLDVSKIFEGENGEILNPRDPSYFEAIVDNVEKHIQVSGSAGSIFPRN
ncbi:MAG: hypothetical protein EA391_15030 [Balneolaceae bacterium]|nr:MAG: hypothetical protein EA391_15030 [Balneolaceae bacterium]